MRHSLPLTFLLAALCIGPAVHAAATATSEGSAVKAASASSVEGPVMRYESMLLEIDRSEIAGLETFKPGTLDEVAEALAGKAPYKVLGRPAVATVVGIPAEMTQMETTSYSYLSQTASGKTMVSTANLGEIQTGFSLMILTAKAAAGVQKITTEIKVHHSVPVGEDLASERFATATADMEKGDYQILTWPNHGKVYALVLQLSGIDKI